MSEMDPLKALEDRLQELKNKLEKSRTRANKESGGAVFTGALAAGAFLLDWTICGGIGTILALGCGVDFIHHGSEARRLRKDVKNLEKIVTDIHTTRALDPAFQKKLEDQSAKAAFDDAAQKRIKELEFKLEDLQRRTDNYFTDTKIVRKDNDKKKGPDGPQN